MKNIFYFVIMLLSIDAFSKSQIIPPYLQTNDFFEQKSGGITCSHEKDIERLLSLDNSKIVWRPYDVLKYSLFMDWTNPLNSKTNTGESRKWDGIQKIQLRIDSANVTSIDLDGDSLKISNVRVNGISLKNIPQPVQSVITIKLDIKPSKGDTLNIELYYSFTGERNMGFYLNNQDTVLIWGQPVYLEERGAYTMSEPDQARYWMPCNDYQHDKAMASIYVKVPKGFSVASNGLLDSVITVDSSSIFCWNERNLISTYLMQATSSKYKEFSTWYKKLNNPADSIELKYYVWQKDYDGSFANKDPFDAKSSFAKVPAMMKAYETVFGEYPFCKYGMVAIQPFYYGGMEHQTMTSINRDWLKGGSELGIAHELAHQWLGDLITCATWNDIWINEGGATWSEAIYLGLIYGDTKYYNEKMAGVGNWYINEAKKNNDYIFQIPIYGIPTPLIFSISSLTYAKAGFLYNMLTRMIGQEFFAGMRKVFDKYKYSYIETKDFQKTLKELFPNTEVPIDTMFNQWLFKAGHPRLNIEMTQVKLPNSTKVILDIKQTQKGQFVPEVFYFPMIISFYDKTDTTKYVSKQILINDSIKRFEFELPLSGIYKIDYDRSISLFEIIDEKLVTGIDDFTLVQESFQVLPNISNNNQSIILVAELNSETDLNSYLIDEQGKYINQIYKGKLDIGKYNLSINTSNLCTGLYFVVCQSNKNVVTKKLVIIK